MHIRHLFRLGLTLAAGAVLGLALIGCGTDSNNRTIPSQFTGDYAGTMIATPGGTIGAVRATIFPSGSVQLDVSTTDGAFIATGGISSTNTLTASGFFNNGQIDFTGIWIADGFGTVTGTWIDRTNDVNGTWSLTQEGVSVAGAAGEYTGAYSMTGFVGSVAFTISSNGSITGSATGFQTVDIPLTGSLTRNNVIVLSGTVGGSGIGETVFFTGTLNTTNFTVTGGTAGTSFNGGVTGTWSAAQTT